jgi:hypothetical protein
MIRAVPAIFLVSLLSCADSSDINVVSDKPVCSADDCIKLDRVATLIPPVDTLEPNIETAVAANSRGEYIVGSTWVQTGLSLYDPNGKFIRQFGRDGDGPGEFRLVWDIYVGPGDSVYVVDLRSGLNVLNPDFTFARRGGKEHVFQDMAFLADGRILVTFQNEGKPDHGVKELDRNTFHLLNYVKDRPTTGLQEHCRKVGLSPDGSLFSVSCYSYEVEQFDTAGKPQMKFVGGPGWLADPDAPKPAIESLQRSKGKVRDIYVDDAQRLWAVVYEFKGGVGKNDVTFAEITTKVPVWLEVFDLKTQRLIGRTTVPGVLFRGFLSDGRLIAFTDDPSGIARIDIYAPQIRGDLHPTP